MRIIENLKQVLEEDKDFLANTINEGMRFAGVEACKEGLAPESDHPAYLEGYGQQYEKEQIAGATT